MMENMNSENQMEADVKKTFGDAKAIYTMLMKLKSGNYICRPELGVLLSESMLEKSRRIVRRLRPYCGDVPDSDSDETSIMTGTIDPLTGKICLY